MSPTSKVTKVEYYEFLGVSRDCNDQELKTAYRRLAMQFHPDRNPDNPQAEEKFKQASEAYQVLSDPPPAGSSRLAQSGNLMLGRHDTGTAAARQGFQQDLWHYTIAKMVDACSAAGIKPFYGPFGDFSDTEGCEAQFRNAYLMGCAGAWTLHPSQIPVAKRVFSPDPAEVIAARKIIAAMPDGTGAVMIDGKMQDDATWKQAKVVVDLANMVAAKDPELKTRYGL